ncbi:MAG: zinc-dependent metalloprotease [Parvularculaceae bacterium]|nr:zinc-dependent metalloprotease [Parvularculaceae bacterium]
MTKTLHSRALIGGSLSVLATATLMTTTALAQGGDKKGPPTIAEKTEGYDVTEGLFPFYMDPKTGKMFMEVGADQLDEEFIAFTYVENGVIEAGAFRGAYADQRVIKFDKHYGALELSEVNTSFYFDPENAISRAKDANISPAIIGSLKIVATTPAEGEDGEARYLIDADALFKSETLTQITPGPNPFSGPFSFQVGGLTRDRTKYDKVKGYPENIDVRVDYVFQNPFPFNQGSSAVTDARSVTLKVQHSIIAMPDDEFTPRYDDYRVGYFFDQVTDQTSYEAAPYRDMINRWRLIKKDPDAAISEPVEPITWWIENTTPVELREAIREGVLAWNEAFEKAGFKDAVVVKVQPDDADWDAGDIRYNVIRWTASPNPPFSGYGPSFTNPRTGEILGADVMLELAAIRGDKLRSAVFATDGLPANFDDLVIDPQAVRDGTVSLSDHGHDDDHHHHSHGDYHHAHSHEPGFIGQELGDRIMFSESAMQSLGATDAELDEMVRQSVVSLSMHEVGHTLGLNHNFKATSVYGPREVHNKDLTQGAPSNSVMDYHAVNIAPIGVEQGDYHHTRPGAYDIWAIEFGYSPDLDDEDVRDALLARSNEPMLTFGNDADDMRNPFNGIDPRVMVFDQSSDPVAYGVDRIELARSIIPTLLEKYDAKGEESYQRLLQEYLVASGQIARMGINMSKQVGGVYVERVEPGQDDTIPYTPVPEETQKAAMKALAKYIFAADAFEVPEDLLRHLQQQRRGFNFFFNTEDPKLHARAVGIQSAVLSQIMSPVIMERLTDSSLYGNTYSAAEVIQDLNEAVFGGDLTGRPNTYRRNLQISYTQRLVNMAYGFGYDPIAQSAALAGIQDVKARFGFLPEFVLPMETRAHRAAIRHELNWLID